MLVLDPSDVEAVPWRNGAGQTRELWVGEHARISVAELTADAHFSRFPDFDRVFVPLAGGFHLVVDGTRIHTTSCGPMTFPGEAAVHVRGLVTATRALNVMTARGRCRSQVALVPPDTQPDTAPDTAHDTRFVVRLGSHDAHVALTSTPDTSLS